MDTFIEMEMVQNNHQSALLMALINDNFDEFKNILEHRAENNINVNYIYGDPENKTLLDIACSRTNRAQYVENLLKHGANVNQINRLHGAAPIHFAILQSDFDTVKLLVEHKYTDIHQQNAAAKTAFHLAAQRRKQDYIELLQIRQAFDVEQTKREIIRRSGHIQSTYVDGACAIQ